MDISIVQCEVLKLGKARAAQHCTRVGGSGVSRASLVWEVDVQETRGPLHRRVA